MRGSAYNAGDIDYCIREGHRFTVIGSDKHPMKRSLMCTHCSSTGSTTIVAYGVESSSFGPWRYVKKTTEAEEEISTEVESDE